MRNASLVSLIICCLLFTSCKEEKVPKPFYPRNDHEAYEHSLQEANLLSTALGNDWKKSAQESLLKPIKVNSPYEEAFYLDPNEADALGYQFSAKRGQKIQIQIIREEDPDAKLFIDLFRVSENEEFKHVATADELELMLGFEPRQDAEYVLRFQPELLRGGKFKVTIENVPTLSFPVAGKTAKAIGSVWGDVRDGGRRSHEGVDIFAKRGTPVLAPTKGYVRFVGKRGIGGNVVWLYDSKRSQSLYFAHLHELIAKQGTYVEPGDTLGTVGNTGNARTTPPHLHFGVYKNGAVNPFYYLQDPPAKVKHVGSGSDLLGEFVRLNRNTQLRDSPIKRQYSASLNAEEVMKVVAMNHNAYRVELPDGKQGYIPKTRLVHAESPIETLSVKVEGDLLKRPDLKALGGIVPEGENLSILGKHAGYWMVKNESGRIGWITDEQRKARRPLRVDPD